MAKTEFTNDQLNAIITRNCDLLVSAAAGSGKTAVLVERIIRIITNKEKPVDVDRLLVVTFTEAAASEMRQRILLALQKALENDIDNENLNRQILILNKASITTIHSFCLNVIRKYFYLIDIDPSFRIIDQTEADLLKTEVMSELFEELYEDEDTIYSTFKTKENINFLNLVESFGDKVKDNKLQVLCLKIYSFIQSSPMPNEWLKNSVSKIIVENITDIENKEWYNIFLDDISESLETALSAIDLILDMLELAQANEKAYQAIQIDKDNIENILLNLDKGLVQIHSNFNFKFSTLTLKVKDEEITEETENIRETIKDIRDTLIKKPIQKIIKKVFFCSPDEILSNMQNSYNNINTLSDIVIAFSNKYYDLKRSRNIADFNDFEHLCIKVLVQENMELSPAAYELKSYYEEVMTDEYQDSNSVQELILSAVSKNTSHEKNRFMVGDIKQSIYKFRMANPDLFIEKYSRFNSVLEENTDELKIDLSQNFRSRKNVLNCINFIFKQIMSPRLGEVTYDNKVALNIGASYPDEENNSFSTELLVINSELNEEITTVQEDDTENIEIDIVAEFSNAELEAKVVANRINEMLNGESENIFFVTDKSGEQRPAQPSDIVILLRSPKSVAEIYTREFKKQNISIFSENSTGYFESVEIMTMISLLRTIDNPRQDIDLIATLYSSIFNITIDELVEIRNIQKIGMFYDGIQAYLLSGDNTELKNKLELFNNTLNAWRTYSINNSISKLVWKIYDETGYVDYCSVSEGGNIRKANLIAFFERAVVFESNDKSGLFNFVKYIEVLQKSSADFGNAKTITGEDNTVRIMSIHKSKGLEFPIVFVCGLGKKFNLMDSKENILLHQKLGIGGVNVDLENRVVYNTISRYAIGNKINEESISEEMRVFYVALTRAKEKLILVGTTKNINTDFKNINMFLTNNISIPTSLLKRKCTFLNFILCALTRHRVSDDYNLDNHKILLNELHEDNSKWIINVLEKSILHNQNITETNIKENFKNIIENLEKNIDYSGYKKDIENVISFEYPHYTASTIPSKISISEIKRMNYESFFKDSLDFETAFSPQTYNDIILAKPKFIEEEKVTGAKIGTLVHKIMENIDFTMNNDITSIKNIVNDMINSNAVTKIEAKHINLNLILNFLNSSLGLRLKSSTKILKEIPFVIGIKPELINADWVGYTENILVHGIIDCIFYENDDIIILDYKSDKVNDNNLEKTLANYKIQLDIYKKAVEASVGTSVKQSIIYFFDINEFFILY